MIMGGSTNENSNQARKARIRLEALAVDYSSQRLGGPILAFSPEGWEGVTIPHNDALVIQTTMAYYK